MKKKGIIYSIEILHKILGKGRIDVSLTIVGDTDLVPGSIKIKRDVVEAVKQKGLDDHVSFLGYVNHAKLISLLYSHHVLLVPSIHAKDGDAEGGFPVIITEAMATGLLVVGFKHCDIPYIIKNELTGFLSPEKNVKLLVKNILKISNDNKLMLSMIKDARKVVENNYDSEKLNNKLLLLYKKACGKL